MKILPQYKLGKPIFLLQLQLAFSALRHNKLRSWLTAITIASAISAIHVHYGLTVRPGERAAQLVDRFESHFLIAFDSLVTTLDREDLDSAAQALQKAGVVQRHDYLCAYFAMEPDPLPLLLCSQTLSPAEASALTQLTQGRMPSAAAFEATVEEAVAERYQLDLGDNITLFKNRPPLKIVGFYQRAGQVPTPDVMAPLEVIQTLKRRKNGLSFSLLELQAGLTPAAALDPIQSLLPDQHILPAKVAAERLRASMSGIRVAAAALAMVIGGLCAAVGLFALVSAVNERMRDFAILRTLGFAQKTIMGSVMLEGLLLGLFGVFKGLIIGETIMYILALQIHPVLAGSSRLSELLLPISVGISVAILGALLPAVKAAYADPQSLLRG